MIKGAATNEERPPGSLGPSAQHPRAERKGLALESRLGGTAGWSQALASPSRSAGSQAKWLSLAVNDSISTVSDH